MLLKLFISFMYIGAFTFGGGYAMLPMFERELVTKRKWLEKEEVADIFATAQCLPGVIASNVAVFVGYKQKGIAGGVMAVLGMITPSIVIVLIIAAVLSNLSEIELVAKAFVGIRICVCVLILNVVIKLWKQSVVDKVTIIVFCAFFLISIFTNIPVAILVLSAGFFGIVIFALKKHKTKSKVEPK